jgi:hypothetical protein
MQSKGTDKDKVPNYNSLFPLFYYLKNSKAVLVLLLGILINEKD